jgi:hypothetical protein
MSLEQRPRLGGVIAQEARVLPEVVIWLTCRRRSIRRSTGAALVLP